VALEPHQAVRLARALRELRESEWPDAELTQAQLATAFSTESRVASATVSSWESTTNPKMPTSVRLSAYARFFATRRSLVDGKPRLLSEKELTPDELDRCREIEDQLLGLLHTGSAARPSTLTFEDGPVTVICPDAPADARGPLASPANPNFTKLQRYADLDALIELYGHLRASNPKLDVYHRLASEVTADNISTHVIVLGGILWNSATRRFQAALGQVPIRQVVNEELLETGEIFKVESKESKESKGEEAQTFLPEWDEPASRGEEGERELVEDVALLARIPNPFKISRTLTICNGIHSRGVLGAVRCLTDAQMRDTNERYLAERFPDGRFAMLLRVPVVSNEALSPDLQNPEARLFEWPTEKGRS
jgi:hypothetical protein